LLKCATRIVVMRLTIELLGAYEDTQE